MTKLSHHPRPGTIELSHHDRDGRRIADVERQLSIEFVLFVFVMSPSFRLFVCLTLFLPCFANYWSIKFSPTHTRTIRRKDFYEIISGPKAYFLLYYLDEDQICRQFGEDWNMLAETYAQERDDVVFLQVNCEFDSRMCRQHAVQGYPFLKVYQNGELYRAYRGVFFRELVREFMDEVIEEMLQETQK